MGNQCRDLLNLPRLRRLPAVESSTERCHATRQLPRGPLQKLYRQDVAAKEAVLEAQDLQGREAQLATASEQLVWAVAHTSVAHPSADLETV